MNLTVAQDQKYQGDDRWKWAVWLEGSDADLDQIQEVTYRLHSSFPNPLRTKIDRSNQFRLESSGWGIFTMPIKVTLKNGEVVRLQHTLQLSYPDGTSNFK